MSKIGLVILLMLMAGSNYAQQNYFVLIQADNGQPFYARMEDKSFSSSAQGHLILSQLKEGTYTITIGFPRKLFPEQQFSITLNKKDLEFQLKDLGEKGWGLFNPQTLELKTGEVKKEDQPQHHLEGVKKDDAFSRLMAGVVSDTAVMYNNYAMEATLRDSPAVSKVVVADTAAAALQGMSQGIKAPHDSAGLSSLPVGTPAAAPSSTGSGAVVASGSVLPPAGTSPDSGVTPAKDTSVLAVNGSSGTGTSKTTNRLDTASYETPMYTKGGAVRTDSAKTDSSALAAAEKSASGLPRRAYDSGVASSGTSTTGAPAGATLSGHTSSGTTSSGLSGAGLPTGTTPSGAVVKLSERKTPKGLRLAFADRQKGRKTDTIIVLIPIDTAARLTQGTTEVGSSVSAPARSDTPATTGTDRPTTPPNGSETTAAKTSSAAAPLFRPDTSQKKPATRLPFINSDCKNFATDYDVDKLRVKMLETAKEEDRVLVARKVFKTKCFTTRQIRALSEVFTSEGQKFKFFETAYPFVSDEHFRELSDLLADPAYNSKFKTMTGQ